MQGNVVEVYDVPSKNPLSCWLLPFALEVPPVLSENIVHTALESASSKRNISGDNHVINIIQLPIPQLLKA